MWAETHVAQLSDDETKHGHEDTDNHDCIAPVEPSLPSLKDIFAAGIKWLNEAFIHFRIPEARFIVIWHIRTFTTVGGMKLKEARASECDSQSKDQQTQIQTLTVLKKLQ